MICRKDLLAQHLQTIRNLCPSGAHEFGFFPETWVLPSDLQRFWNFLEQNLDKDSGPLLPFSIGFSEPLVISFGGRKEPQGRKSWRGGETLSKWLVFGASRPL